MAKICSCGMIDTRTKLLRSEDMLTNARIASTKSLALQQPRILRVES